MGKFNGDFGDDVQKEFLERIKNAETVARYTIELDGDLLAGVPIIFMNRFMNKMTNGITDDYELEDMIMHYAVKGKTIKISLDGAQVGAMIMNGLQDDWDSQPVFKEHPIAFNVMKEAITWSIVKKLTPPLKKDPGAKVAAQ